MRAAAEVLQKFTACFNARDAAGMDACLHFPHVLLSGSQLVIWDKPGSLPANFFGELERSGWDRTVYTYLTPILVSADKVHFDVGYSRLRKDGGVLTTHRNIWFATREQNRWGIKLRSY